MKISGVYQFKNIINNKIYIGSSFDVLVRKRKHLSELRKNIHKNKYFQNAFNKYGEQNFIFEVLEEVEVIQKTIEFRDNLVYNREQFYLDTLLLASENDNRFNELGYNNCRKANSTLGFNHSIDTIIKIKSYIKTEDSNRRRSEAMKGKNTGVRSIEVKDKIRNSLINQNRFQCTYCNENHTKTILVRFHNDNCKLNKNRTQDQIDKRRNIGYNFKKIK